MAVISDIVQISDSTAPLKLPRLIHSGAQSNSIIIPKYNPIRVGTLIAVNYAGYHLPPWCYFREKWSDVYREDLRQSDSDKVEVVMKGMGEDNTFLTRAHEFQYYNKPDNTYRYWKKEYAHYVDTWMKFASNDNDELSPPTMNENHFDEIKSDLLALINEYNNDNNFDGGSKIPLPPIDPTEFTFNKFLDSHKYLLNSKKINELLDKIKKYRWKQEEVLIREIHRRIESILKPDSTEFPSVQERRVEYDKELDRVVRGLFAHRMRFDVRLSEIEEIKIYLGLEKRGDENTLFNVLDKLEKIREEGPENPNLTSEINKLRNCCLTPGGTFLTTEPKQEIDYPDFRALKEELAPLIEYFKKRQDEIITIFRDHNPDGIKWNKLKEEIMAMEPVEKNRFIEEILNGLRSINIEQVQIEEGKINRIKERVDCVKKGVKQVAQQILYKIDKLLKEDKQPEMKEQHLAQQLLLQSILSHTREKIESPFSVDDLNTYLRYPPIQNKLVLHEGYWPPLRAVPSEGTISVERMGSPGTEYHNVKLSNVIARFDEAFSLFSSTLADHGMCRPTPQPRPMKFRYGLGEVVPAWDHGAKGISDMKLGEIRIMVCPSLTAYGGRGVPDSVPPYMPLVYVVRMDGIYNKQDDIYESDDDIPSDQLDSQDENTMISS